MNNHRKCTFRWDTRKLNEPLERLLVDPIKSDDQVMARSYGVTVLEYETTMPTKFMCGTDVGMVFVCNRKGKTPVEKINFRVIFPNQILLLIIAYYYYMNTTLVLDSNTFGTSMLDNAESKFPEKLSHRWRLDSTYLVRGLSRELNHLDKASTGQVDRWNMESNKVSRHLWQSSVHTIYCFKNKFHISQMLDVLHQSSGRSVRCMGPTATA